jgi:hypothetical protein
MGLKIFLDNSASIITKPLAGCNVNRGSVPLRARDFYLLGSVRPFLKLTQLVIFFCTRGLKYKAKYSHPKRPKVYIL